MRITEILSRNQKLWVIANDDLKSKSFLDYVWLCPGPSYLHSFAAFMQMTQDIKHIPIQLGFLVRITIVEKSNNNFITINLIYSYNEDNSCEDYCDLKQFVRNIIDEIDRIYFLFY